MLLTLFCSALLATIRASPVEQYDTHEKRESAPPGWVAIERIDRKAILPMRVGLAQSNLDKGHDWLMEVSHPESALYGKHWTVDEVAEAFAPSDATVLAVRQWLVRAGIEDHRVSTGRGRSWLYFNATVDEAESLLHTEYSIYQHESGRPHVACSEYSIPSDLKEHIDFVYPTVQFDAQVEKRDTEAFGGWGGHGKRPGWPGGPPGWGPPRHHPWEPRPWHGPNYLQYCDSQITPDCLRALYSFGPNDKATQGNSYGIVEYTPQAYLPADLDLFFRNFSEQQVGDRPILESIQGGVLQTQHKGFGYNGESDLDLEYAMALVYPQQVTLYQVGDPVEGASFNNFLDGIDGTYCTYKGGDDPVYDAPYPDPAKGGYKNKDCGIYKPAKVISTSYGYDENDLPEAYMRRQCYEYMKLGLQGVSSLFSSGDAGVAGNYGYCLVGPGLNATTNKGKSGRFNPSFPPSCPYVTAVGATQVKPGTNIVKALASGTEPERACETVIYSGGGFSNVFALPSYQASNIHEWFDNFPPPYSASQFNDTEETRGFPDISANGANYVVYIDGKWELVYGTSASSPTLGSVLTLINQARLEAGKSSIGFINPVSYLHPEVFNDITQGDNPGCGTKGFSAAPGWDPVTGLGTPNFEKMKKLWLSLG